MLIWERIGGEGHVIRPKSKGGETKIQCTDRVPRWNAIFTVEPGALRRRRAIPEKKTNTQGPYGHVSTDHETVRERNCLGHKKQEKRALSRLSAHQKRGKKGSTSGKKRRHALQSRRRKGNESIIGKGLISWPATVSEELEKKQEGWKHDFQQERRVQHRKNL